MNLASRPPCLHSACCSSMRQYIRVHLDPNNEITADDDAEQIIEQLDDCLADEGGSRISVATMREYIEELAEEAEDEEDDE